MIYKIQQKKPFKYQKKLYYINQIETLNYMMI